MVTINIYQREKLDISIYSHWLSHSSCTRLLETPVNCSPPGSSVHGILQARILE